MKDYKKILEGVENIINTTEKSDIGFANICTYIGENCPELRESEGEMIRKELIDFLEYYRLNNVLDSKTISLLTDSVAWLEKQCSQISANYAKTCKDEQKPVDFSDLRTWKYIVDAVWTEKEGIGQYLDSPFTEEVAKKLQKRFGNVEQKPADKVDQHSLPVSDNSSLPTFDESIYHPCTEEVYEQKPNKWSEEDIMMKGEIINVLQKTGNYEKEINWLKSLKERVQPQPKQKWSEEDKEFMERSISNLTELEQRYGEDYGMVGKCINWIKSLKDRVQPQTKQDWIEEDEARFESCIKVLQTSDGYDTINVKWLKSLKYRYTLKPSDEQMNVLNEVLNFAANHESPHWNDYIFGTLNNLIRQLKRNKL